MEPDPMFMDDSDDEEQWPMTPESSEDEDYLEIMEGTRGIPMIDSKDEDDDEEEECHDDEKEEDHHDDNDED